MSFRTESNYENIILVIAVLVIYPSIYHIIAIHSEPVSTSELLDQVLLYSIQLLLLSANIFVVIRYFILESGKSYQEISAYRVMLRYVFLASLPLITVLMLLVVIVDWSIGITGTFVVVAFWSGGRRAMHQYIKDPKTAKSPIFNSLQVGIGSWVFISALLTIIVYLLAQLLDLVLPMSTLIKNDLLVSPSNAVFVGLQLTFFSLFVLLILMAWVRDTMDEGLSWLVFIIGGLPWVLYLALLVNPVFQYFERRELIILGSYLQILSWVVGYFVVQSRQSNQYPE